MKSKKILLSATLIAATSIQCFSWGQKGHDTVCFIAENHLTPVAKATAEKLLGGKSIVYYANWLDNASHTPEYSYSKTWHYKNIDANETFENAQLHESGDVVRAIREQAYILNNPDHGVSPAQMHGVAEVVGHASFAGGCHQYAGGGVAAHGYGYGCIVEVYYSGNEVRALLEYLLAAGNGFAVAAVVFVYAEVGGFKSLVDVQAAGLAVEAGAVVVEDAVGDVGRLLYLQHHRVAERVYAACRQIEIVAGHGPELCQKRHHRAVCYVLAQCLGSHAAL